MGYRMTYSRLIGALFIAGFFGVIEAGGVWQTIATIPEFVWELSLGIWLIVKGFNPSAPLLTASAT